MKKSKLRLVVPMMGIISLVIVSSFLAFSNHFTNTARAAVRDPGPPYYVYLPIIFMSPNADLSVTITDGVTDYIPGGLLTYTVEVYNNGPSDMTGGTVTIPKPTQISSWTFTCVHDSGAVCTHGPSSPAGSISDLVDIPAGKKVTYTIVAAISGAATGNLVTTVTVSPPLSTPDLNLANNSASDSDVPPSTTLITADTPDPSVPGALVTVNVTVTGLGTIPTGTVDITGADTNCSLTLTAGSGSCNVIFTSTGVRSLTATYSGNANYAGSSDTESHTVQVGLIASATTITSHIPEPSAPGELVVVSVTVSGAGIPAPTGIVQITGADTNCSILLAGGSGSCGVIFNAKGHKIITATYSGDVIYAASSGSIGHLMTKGSTTTTITADIPDPSAPMQAVGVSFTVLGAGVTPTGTVAITGADVNCSIPLSGGTGTCFVIFNTIGAKTLTATYSGDANYDSSLDTEPHSVRNATTTIITSDNPDPSFPGDTVTVTVTVNGAGVSPTGNVDITGADTNCSFALAGGSGSCNVTFLTAGAKLLTATYAGDANYVGSVGTANHTVDRGPLTLFTMGGLGSSAPFALVTVTVNVNGAGVTPTGTVAISGATTECTITLAGGTGSCDVMFDTVGPYTVVATYSGDGNYVGSFITGLHTVP